MQIRVPIDDTHTWVMFYSVHAPDGIAPRGDTKIVDYPIPFQDETGKLITDYVEGQDMMAWVSQGPIADRSDEILGQSDQGVIRLRKMFRDALDAVAAGQDPPAVQRVTKDRIELPLERSKFGSGAEFALQWLAGGSMRYSPQNDLLRQLHIEAARARGEQVDAA
jgi:5,5'-dehydrodivanillate O-demethylase